MVTYEGQAAIELEQLADPVARGSFPVELSGDPVWRILGADLIRGVVGDLRAGVAVATIAGRFHNAVADVIVASCERARQATGLGVVALSGGVFQNVLLTERSVEALSSRGFRVLIHTRVPPNDAGISLGQAAIVGARDRAGWPAG